MKRLGIVFLFAFGGSLLAQSTANHVDPTTNTGIHVGSIGVPMGSVNQANGNLSIAIPLISLPGKAGSGISLSLMYDSKNWNPHVTDQEDQDLFITWQYEQWRWPVGDWGWHLNLPSIELPTDAFYSDNGSDAGHYILTLSDGTKHSISAAQSGLSSEDGEAIRLDFQAPNGSCWACAVATLKDGTRLEFMNSNGRVSKMTDRNGNVTTVTDTSPTSVTVTDSAGHQLVLSRSGSSSKSPYTSITYTDTNGTTQTIYFDISTLNLFSTSSSSDHYVASPAFLHPVQTGNTCGLCLNGHVWVSGIPSNLDTNLLTGIRYSADTSVTYSFEYNGYGEVTKVRYPTGGYARYDYTRYLVDGPAYNAMQSDQDFREVTLQALCAKTSGSCSPSEEIVTKFNPAPGTTANAGLVQTEAFGTSMSHDISISLGFVNLGNPHEILRQKLDHGGNVLQQVTTEYVGLNDDSTVFPSKITTWLCGNSSSTTTTMSMSYDSAPLRVMVPFQHVSDFQTVQTVNEPVDQVVLKQTYDYITSPACSSTATPNTGSLLRQEVTSYLSSDPNYGTLSTAHIPMLPSSTQIQDATGNPLVGTSFVYDLNSSPYQGNPTTITTSGGTGALSASASQQRTYTSWGGLLTDQDPRGAITTFTYGSDGNYPYPTTVERPQTGNVHHFDYYDYDANTGLQTAHVDENGGGITDAAHKTSFTYDSMLRLHSTDYPPTNVGTSHVELNYTANQTDQYTRVSPGKPDLHAATVVDGLGRQVQTLTFNAPLPCSGNTIYTDTSYDSLGRVEYVSNPYCSTGDSTFGQTHYVYDAIGRKTDQFHPDGSNLHWDYSGNVTDAYDETLRHWQRTSDALGRLTRVMELGTATDPLNLETDYGYDVQGNLLSVSQLGAGEGAQTRTFQYDALSRLRASNNPENASPGNPASLTCVPGGPWTTCYTYDANGNVHTKTDNRGVQTTFNYDALNRLTSKTYSGGSAATTPSSCYQYDAATNGGGRLGVEWTQYGVCPATSPASGWLTRRSILAYDPMGRVKQEQQCHGASCTTTGTPFNQTLNYDLAGNLTSYTNGLGSLSFSRAYDGVGRLLGINSSWVDMGHPSSLYYVTSFYPNGAAEKATVGLGIYVTNTYDNRLRWTGTTAAHP